MTTQERMKACLAKARIFKPENIAQCSRESGWHPDALRALSSICKDDKKLRIYRQRKWEAIQYENQGGYRAKPMAVKLKSQSSGPYVALVMVPEKLDSLPLDAQTQVKALVGRGYRLQPTGKKDGWTYLVDPKGNKFYSDIDPMGTYLQVRSGGFVRCEPDNPRIMNSRLGRKIWDDPDMERAYGGGAQDSYWNKKTDGVFEMRPDPAVKAKLQGKFDDATIIAMGATVRVRVLPPKDDEKYLVAAPDGSLYMMGLPLLKELYTVTLIGWPY